MSNIENMSMQQLAAHIAAHCKMAEIELVLVGGLAVACYTQNRYLTKDIDMVDISYQKPAILNAAMSALGFCKKGRIYVSNKTDIVVEFPPAPLAVGDELISESTVFVSPYGDIPILKATDVVKDRLAAFFHWQDRQSLVQALCIMLCHDLTPFQVETFCSNEGHSDFLPELSRYYNTLKIQGSQDMAVIEAFVAEQFIKQL